MNAVNHEQRQALIAEVRDLFDEGWCVCRSSTLGAQVLDQLVHDDAALAEATDVLNSQIDRGNALALRMADALAEIDASMYGDPETPFRLRAHLEPHNRGVTFNVAETRVPVSNAEEWAEDLRRLRSRDRGHDVGGMVATLSTWIDDSYEDLAFELHARRRVDKLMEEVGEVGRAMGGWFGENPRKGVTHTKDDVLSELLDVAVTALGAFESLTGNDGTSIEALRSKMVQLLDRVGLPVGS